jgi:hypothetical protein
MRWADVRTWTSAGSRPSRTRTAPLSDTPPEAEEIQIALLRDLPPRRNLHLAAEFWDAARELMLSGLRYEYPHALPAFLQRRLMDLMLGPEVAAGVYEGRG